MVMNPELAHKMIMGDAPQQEDAVAKKTITPSVFVTPDQIMEELASLKGKIKLAFYDEDGKPVTDATARTWHIKNGAAEDSGSLSVPIKVIARKANELARARFPAVIKDEFDKGAPVLG